jgi:hypothetical protein
MLSTFQTTNNIQFFFVTWPPQLGSWKLFAFKGNWVPILDKDPTDYKVTALLWTLNLFAKSKNFNIGEDKSLFFKSLKSFC